MIHATITLLRDIYTRGLRGLAVVLLTALIAGSITIGAKTVIDALIPFIIIGGVTGIVLLIRTDKTSSMRSSKSNVYSTLIAATLWFMAFIFACTLPQTPFFESHVEHDGSGNLTALYATISPILVIIIFGLLVIASGMIAYAIGKKRKDIKGIKKEELFR